MKRRRSALLLALLAATTAPAEEEFFDRISQALSIQSGAGQLAARLSGSLDLETYAFSQPAPGLIQSQRQHLLNPRLSVFLDAQAGRRLYAFGQVRVDRGFDPSDRGLRTRIDEYALRLQLREDGRLGLQVGRFSTIVGRWTLRHASWENPFITAPLAYEHLTAMWDSAAARSTETLLKWGHLRGSSTPNQENADRHLRLPVIWGPSYATGAVFFGRFDSFEFAAEIKNSSLSSRPEAWHLTREAWSQPTLSARLGFRPSMAWNLGLSASSGSYLLPSARGTLAPGTGLGNYRQTVVLIDASYAWRHFQAWAELVHGRFEIPRVGLADTISSFVEIKYKLTPRWAAAVRINRQTFGNLRNNQNASVPWGRDLWRADFAPTFRFSANLQAKLQYSIQKEEGRPHAQHIGAGQVTVRF